MKRKRRGNGLHSNFEQALAENAVARSRFESLGPKEQEALRARARDARGLEENKRLLDEMVGWQEGHPPYQL